MCSKFKFALLAPVLLGWLLAGCDAGAPEPNLAPAKAKAEQCVEPTADMRRNHMSYLKAHRDEAVIEGVRTTKYSLNECISCHVDPVRTDGSPVHYADAQKDHFCASCHSYVGVKLDCFQCHADRPDVMQQPNYQHKLSSQHYHLVAEPSASDLMVVGNAKGAVQ